MKCLSLRLGAALALSAASLVASSAPALARPVAAKADEAFVRPDVQAYLDKMKKNPRPPMNAQTVAMIRKIPPAMLEKMYAAMGDAPMPVLAVDRKLTMPGPGGTMDLRLFDTRADRAPGPILVFFHGGGFVAGSIGSHASLAAEIGRQLDVPVVSVEYRLAPEAKWPAAPDDAEAAARWVAANGEALGRSATSLILSGDSAGGTLTLLTALALRNKPAAVPVKLAIPIYPMADASRPYPSMARFSGGFGLDKADMDFFTASYAADKNSPRHSALLNKLRGFPPTVLATASLDPLHDSGVAFVQKLKAAKVPVKYYEAQGNIHGYATFRKAIPSAQNDLDAIMMLSREMLAKM